MGRGKKRTSSAVAARAAPLSAVAARRGSTQQRSVKSRLGKHPSKNFLPFQEKDIFEAVDMIASEEHRDLIEWRIRADTGKITSVQFTDDGPSRTDMQGRVWVRDYSTAASRRSR